MRTVVIPSAGTGSRLGELTRNYNKAMCTLGPKPVISYIIEHFNKEDEIIILLGYKGDYLKQVVKALYPDWNISFVDVDKFEGEGSGLGYSLSCAITKLQKPFIFWPNDTLVENDFSEMPDCNWIMVGDANKDCSNYRHALIGPSNNVTILPKNATGYYNSFPYTGVCYIKDYEDFWRMFFANKELFIEDGEVVGLNNLKTLTVWPALNWIDTGNRQIFDQVKKEYSERMEENILEKPDEAIWFIDNRVIKFHIDEKFISDRVKRFKTFLSDQQKNSGIKIPELISYSKNTYTYKREDGVVASKVINPVIFKNILDKFFCKDNILELSDEEKLAVYTDFYKNKTNSRINKFCAERNCKDDLVRINGLDCLPAMLLIDLIDWEYLSKNGIFTQHYHGDFHLENILVQNNNFVMLDWRQNFGKSEYGDMFYDLAKMWHSLIVNHNMVCNERFTIRKEKEIFIDIDRTFVDTECETVLKDFISSFLNDESIKQSRLLTALIFLNIAACHIGLYSDFLFYLGKYMINDFFQYNKFSPYFKQDRIKEMEN